VYDSLTCLISIPLNGTGKKTWKMDINGHGKSWKMDVKGMKSRGKPVSLFCTWPVVNGWFCCSLLLSILSVDLESGPR